MRKKIACKDVDEIDLEFMNGEIITLRFDVQAMMEFNDIEGGLSAATFSGFSLPEMCARIIYAGSTNHTDGMTYEKAREIVSDLNPATITEIINAFNDSMGVASSEAQQELSKKVMAQFIQKIAK